MQPGRRNYRLPNFFDIIDLVQLQESHEFVLLCHRNNANLHTFFVAFIHYDVHSVCTYVLNQVTYSQIVNTEKALKRKTPVVPTIWKKT